MTDDWREETKLRLNTCKLYTILVEKCINDSFGSHTLSLIDDATHYAYQRAKTTLRHMGEFTLHDGDHTFRILKLMECILGNEYISELSIPEHLLLILSASFHDIGMAPTEKEVIAWKKVWDSNPQLDSAIEITEYDKFKRFYSSRVEEIERIESFIKQNKNNEADLAKGYLVSEYIRITHPERAKEILQNDWSGKIKYKDCDLTVELAEICYSHNEDPLSVLNLDQSYLCGPEVYANFQLIAMTLRLSDLLDFDSKRTPPVLFSHLFVRHPVSLTEWNKHRAVQSWNISPKSIQFHAKCTHPAIESSIHSFCDLIDRELSSCNNIISVINSFNENNGRLTKLSVPFKVDRSKIETQKDISGEPKYIYKETQFNLSKNQVIDLLMGTKLYGDPEVALRELIQNSIDACLLRKALEDSWGNLYEPEIKISYNNDGENDILEIVDNGTGMDQYIIDNYYSKVGSSFYKSTDFYELKAKTNSTFMPTSRFGIGILSCFMVADTIVVDTRRVYAPHESSKPINLTIEGQESIFWIKNGLRKTPGTSTTLYLRKNKNPWDRMNEDDFIKSIETVVPNPPFKIAIHTASHQKIQDQNSFNLMQAASLKNKTWGDHNNIRQFEVKFNLIKDGFVGSAIIAVLEKHNIPNNEIAMTSTSVEIDGDNYNLERTIRMSGNEITQHSTTITIDEDGEIDQSTTYSKLCTSESRLSLHGIEVPTTLFPDSWRTKKKQVSLSWPFPMMIVIDICGTMDLDLNSSRTQVNYSHKWKTFEEKLAYSICKSIQDSTNTKYWNEFKNILLNSDNNDVFINSLELDKLL